MAVIHFPLQFSNPSVKWRTLVCCHFIKYHTHSQVLPLVDSSANHFKRAATVLNAESQDCAHSETIWRIYIAPL